MCSTLTTSLRTPDTCKITESGKEMSQHSSSAVLLRSLSVSLTVPSSCSLLSTTETTTRILTTNPECQLTTQFFTQPIDDEKWHSGLPTADDGFNNATCN